MQKLASRLSSTQFTDNLLHHHALQVSRRKLEVRFRISMHCSVHEFLIQVRIEAAKQLLKFSDKPIEEIAALTGFCHAPCFVNTFKKYSGVSPLKYLDRP
jgi:LacI family transcriptional regulator